MIVCKFGGTSVRDAAAITRLAPDEHRRVVEIAVEQVNWRVMIVRQGHMADVLRLPLVPLADAHRDTVRLALQGAGALGD